MVKRARIVKSGGGYAGVAFYNAVGPIIESHAPPSTRVILLKPQGAMWGGYTCNSFFPMIVGARGRLSGPVPVEIRE